MAKEALASEELAKKFAPKKRRHTPLGEGRRARHHPGALRAQPAHRRAEALGAARRQRACSSITTPRAPPTTATCCEIPPGKTLEPQRQLFEEMILVARRPRLDHGVEQRGQAHHLRVEGGLAVRHPAQLPGTSTSTARARRPARYVGVTNAPPVINLYEDLDFVFNCEHDFKNRFNGEPDYFSAKGEQKGLLLRDQLRGRRDQPAADQRQGARRRRRPHPLQHGQGLDEQPHLAVPGRHLQEGPRARAGRAT